LKQTRQEVRGCVSNLDQVTVTFWPTAKKPLGSLCTRERRFPLPAGAELRRRPDCDEHRSGHGNVSLTHQECHRRLRGIEKQFGQVAWEEVATRWDVPPPDREF
jgi:hypothetical protein